MVYAHQPTKSILIRTRNTLSQSRMDKHYSIMRLKDRIKRICPYCIISSRWLSWDTDVARRCWQLYDCWCVQHTPGNISDVVGWIGRHAKAENTKSLLVALCKYGMCTITAVPHYSCGYPETVEHFLFYWDGILYFIRIAQTNRYKFTLPKPLTVVKMTISVIASSVIFNHLAYTLRNWSWSQSHIAYHSISVVAEKASDAISAIYRLFKKKL